MTDHVLLAELRRPSLEAQGWRTVTPGADGLGLLVHRADGLALIHSIATEEDGRAWAHVSLSLKSRKLPSWVQTRDAWRLVYPERAGIIVIPPAAEHFSIAEVMHVFGCLDGDVLPDFLRGGASL